MVGQPGEDRAEEPVLTGSEREVALCYVIPETTLATTRLGEGDKGRRTGIDRARVESN